MFIGRRPDGTIYGAWTCQQPQDADHLGIEEVSDDHPDLVAFITRDISQPKVPTLEERVAALEARART
jgi:hypothetical protein